MTEPQRQLLPIATAARSRRALVSLLRPQLPTLVAAAVLLTTATAAGLLVPPVLGRIVDVVAADGELTTVAALAVMLLVAAVVQGVLTAFGNAVTARLGETTLARLRERVVHRVLRLPLERVEAAGSGDLVSRVGNDVALIGTAVREVLPTLASATLTTGLTIVGLGVLDWRYALAGLAAVPIQLHTLRWHLRHSGPLYAAERVAEGNRAQQLLDTVGGARTVRSYRAEAHHQELVRARSASALGYARRTIRLQTRFFGRLNLAEYVGLALVLAMGFALVRADVTTVGTAAAAALYFHRLFDPINILLGLFDEAQRAGSAFARLVGIDDLAEPAPPTDPATPSDHAVSVGAVSYAYLPGHDVLRAVDVHVAPGERIAVVGASGAGKSTLAKLVAGIHAPTAGTVRIGGVDLDRIAPAQLRRHVALVTQEVHVFAGSVRDDLTLVRPDATDAELRTALTAVHAWPWVTALADGLDTVVGSGGHRLTAAQAQQLALARLVLADVPVVVLDEATAETGSSGAYTLEAAATVALASRTAIVVAHRLTQAAAADRVVVLGEGRVVETGRHHELLDAGGSYATLWSAWQSGRG